MQIRSRVYLQMVSRVRALGALISPDGKPDAQEASPVLIFIAVALALLLVLLEIDMHGAQLQSLGFVPLDSTFVGP